MSDWVLPNVLDYRDVNRLPEEVFYKMSHISTGIILSMVNEFVEKHEVDDGPIGEAARKLHAAYSEVNSVNQYLSSPEAKELADSLASLQYSDISATTDIQTLTRYRTLIIELLGDDEEFMETYGGGTARTSKGYMTAYTRKMDSKNFYEVLEEIRNTTVTTQDEKTALLSLCGRLEDKWSLFKNAMYSANKPTVLRKAIYKKDKLVNILKGIDFLLERNAVGAKPVSWRRV